MSEAQLDAPTSDAEWVRLLGDSSPRSDAARRLLRVHLVRGLIAALSRHGVGEDHCEDFAQEAIVRVLRRLGSFRGDSRFTTWALSIALRVAFDELRRLPWKDVSFAAVSGDGEDSTTFEPRMDASQERQVLRTEVERTLKDVLERELTPKQRSALSAELSGMPHQEIAEALGMNRNAVYKLTHDARKKVKARLEAAGLLAADVLSVFDSGK
jgi:RNA polymerase sigma-70 factor (ECF subfamily)